MIQHMSLQHLELSAVLKQIAAAVSTCALHAAALWIHVNRACMQVLSCIASHLADMHEAGYVHGNIKPSNILWLPRQAVWTTVDMAHACHVGTAVPAVVHTLAYAAPETVQAFMRSERSMQAATAADAWAVGVIAFELLYGGPALPVEGQGRAKVCYRRPFTVPPRCAVAVPLNCAADSSFPPIS